MGVTEWMVGVQSKEAAAYVFKEVCASCKISYNFQEKNMLFFSLKSPNKFQILAINLKGFFFLFLISGAEYPVKMDRTQGFYLL